jgi:DHA1 family bicyclomycin/chloramphenicol resistance-like MFS transporter
MFLRWCHNVRMDFAFMSLSFISASQLNSILLRKFSSEQMIFRALIVQSVISITFWLHL